MGNTGNEKCEGGVGVVLSDGVRQVPDGAVKVPKQVPEGCNDGVREVPEGEVRV